MSSRSSHYSGKSLSSSAGETVATSHSTGSSSRHRRAGALGIHEPRAPPVKMSAPERLQLIRNSITRLQYICERQYHTAALDQAAEASVSAFFERLRKKLSRLEFSRSHIGTPETGGPQQLRFITKEVGQLMSTAKEVVRDTESTSATATAVYAGLHHHHMQEALAELEELSSLLASQPADLLSRVNTELLADLVAFHIDEFDAFMAQRVEAFVRETQNEGALYSGAVMTDASQRAAPIGVCSAVLLDVAVGVRPGRSARIVIEHTRHQIRKVENRLHAADVALQGHQPTSDAEKQQCEGQRREYTIMKDRVTHALRELERVQLAWEEEEQTTFTRAASGSHDLAALVQGKHLRETEIIEGVQRLHDQTIHACLPFAVPQYHRRYGETYSQPCHIRIGFHFLPDTNTAAELATSAAAAPTSALSTSSPAGAMLLHTLSAEFLALMRQLRVAPADYGTFACLVPSKEQCWVNFAEFPEMVKGARCALRDVDTRLDHSRALEEQKEVGGYFVMNGGERILRALLMQRCNVPINIFREKFVTQGPHFAPKAVVIRCKRPSGLTAQNYFYYTTTGELIFSFARKVVWHLPVSFLLSAVSTQNVSAVELQRLLTIGMPDGAHAARVEALLQHHRQKPYGELRSFLDYMTVLGRMYREYHQSSSTYHFLPLYTRGTTCQHDAWYGMFMLRRHVLPHLNSPTAATPDLAPDATAAELMAWLSPALLEELDRKFNAMIAITRQLYCFIDGAVEHQGNDVPAYQELFTVSQVLIGAFEVCLNRYMRSFIYRLGRHMPAALFKRILRLRSLVASDAEDVLRQVRQFVDYCSRHGGGDPLDQMKRLLVTGNMNLDREEDFYCPQTSGWVVMAEHLNFYRFFEQLRCVHRGKTIAGMRSSEVRKYPCEAYGFICMVHSPDGEDCGVLNHLSVSAVVSNSPDTATAAQLRAAVVAAVPNLRCGATQCPVVDQLCATVPVWVEGELLGYVTAAEAATAAAALREGKALTLRSQMHVTGVVRRKDATPLHTMEVIYVAPQNKDPAGLYVFYDCGRLMRPVQQLESAVRRDNSHLPFPLVFIGTWESSWMDVAAVPSDPLDAVVQLNKKYTYMEQNGSNLISLTSTTIPFFEYNCSPRNLFQCGLSKQSSGTQLQALAWRKEAKLFRTYCPQRYISRTLPMDYYNLDDVNLGVNAVIAILAYTGYDMDDAVVINSTAAQRGMLTAGITVAKIVTASGKAIDKDDVFVFHNVLSTGERFTGELEANGLPPKRANPRNDTFSFDRDHKYPGLRDSSDVYCCAKRVERTDPFTNKTVYEYTRHHATKWRHFDKGEDGWVQQVIPLVYSGPDPTSVLLVLRIPRPPTVGDKFSSRHGQKGTLPLHVRSHDLPFATASGITPDVIINPHAFPSRMTVGMVLEIMTAKVGAVEGRFMDNSAWATVDEQPRVAEVIGDALSKAGYNRYGREHLIDGISGEEMEADVFMGICGYQRLRHMVNDKWQARARTDAHTYRAVTKTGQPVKGRKRHGGVRVGEMERDGLLSHGISEVVVDRLLHVSDKTKAFICPRCGSLLSLYERHATEYGTWRTCRFCGAGADESTDTIAMVEIPQVLRLWAAELTSIGVRVVLKTSELSDFA
ncbi:putative RNA polymerase I second largest subunit [Leptomonas pyrrhocoris]|uniref:DNA-directed RNA polymerase subunit beta n=1 Tax=Leptomonas pyrrhocoris TaxID=157538 RepID=A0A0N0VEW4_LEPPY|nr:putative RNA polymerase I second largest subunit [Leptomonas pyrrhocoris]KPA79471.1 putative RNA polymerase I second largest subunit [Leptomonas pyrrhocoris]|eukprot:XP_015657910.1 putative RNA polymerase I second largest subunit [Leptomonas pyrrhocoris]